MGKSDEIKENLEKQLFELEMLQSIYANSNEFVVEDEAAEMCAREFLASEGAAVAPESNLGFVIRFSADCLDETTKEYFQIPLEIVCRLPKLYPLKSCPDVLVRSRGQSLNRQFSQELSKHVRESHANDSSILSIIEWVKENVGLYLGPESNSGLNAELDSAQEKLPKTIAFSRMFIYSHHIYSLEKRRTIVHLARELDLCGFMMPGKPGIICVEGHDPKVQEFWIRLKAIQWHKLQIKDLMTVQIEEAFVDQVKKFSNFEEKVFSASETGVDIGGFFIFLKQIGLEPVFNLYFGVEGKLPQQT